MATKSRSPEKILCGHLKDYTNRPSLLESILPLSELENSINAVPESNRCSALAATFAQRNSILHKAAKEHDIEVFKLVIGSVRVDEKFELLKLQNAEGSTPLHLMREPEFCGNIQHVLFKMSRENVTELMKFQDEKRETLLHKASLTNSASLRYLLNRVRFEDRFSLISVLNEDGQTPLFCATASGTQSDEKVRCILAKLSDEECMQLLKSQTSTGLTLLHCASEKPTLDVFKYLLEHHRLPADQKTDLFKVQDDRGFTVLHKACSSASTEVVTYMFDGLCHKVRHELLSVTDKSGGTPLHCAATSKGVGLFERLLARMPPNDKAQLLSIQNNKGDTALVCALKNSTTSAAQAIIESVEAEFVSDILNIANKEGKTAMDIARAHNSQSAVLLLQQFTNMENVEESQDSHPSTSHLSFPQDGEPIKNLQTDDKSPSNSVVTVTPRVFSDQSPTSSPRQLVVDEDQTSSFDTEPSSSALNLSYSAAGTIKPVIMSFEEFLRANSSSADFHDLSPVTADKQTKIPHTITTSVSSSQPTHPPVGADVSRPAVVSTENDEQSEANISNSSFWRSSPDLPNTQHRDALRVLAAKRSLSASASAQSEKSSKTPKLEQSVGWVESRTLRFKYHGRGHIMSFKPDNTVRELIQQITEATSHDAIIRDLDGFTYSKDMTLDLVKPPFEFHLNDVRVLISEEKKGPASHNSQTRETPEVSSSQKEFGRVGNVQEVVNLLSFVHQQMKDGKTLNRALKAAQKNRKTIDRFLNIYYLHEQNKEKMEELEKNWTTQRSPGGLQGLDDMAKKEINWDQLKALFREGTVADFRLKKER